MADSIPGGYYLELDREGKPLKAHNAHGQEVEILTDAQIQEHEESGTPAPLKAKASADEGVKAEQQAAADSGKSAGKGKKK